ncbi:MAG: hypothetical protein HY683_02325 [Chloroflexi bacterium]|nr:hypothetical protein [Chloroflexota bacterium]
MTKGFKGALLFLGIAALVILVACRGESSPTPTPTPLLPGQLTPRPAPERVRLDLGDGIVVAFVEGLLADLPGKVVYVTHVPSGTQVVLDREGRIVERHDGRGDGPARMDAVLADEAAMGRIMAGLRSAEDARPRQSAIDWVPFIKFGGVTYVQNWRFGTAEGERQPMEDDLGTELYRVAFRLDGNVGVTYRSEDGDAAYLNPGTRVYAVKGYDPQFRLAAVADRRVRVFEADTNPAAKVGADLLDIRGKVRSIGINSPQDGRTELASMSDPEILEGLVGMVLTAPVDQGYRSSNGEPYFIAFHLEDGTAVTRAFWLESGELSRGIMMPAFFQVSVLRALAGAAALPPPGGTRITKALAVKLALESFKLPEPEIMPVEDARDPVARLMRLGEYVALTGGSTRENADSLVWVVEAEGMWRSAGIVPVESRTTYRYASVAIDAETGNFIASSRTHEPLFGR